MCRTGSSQKTLENPELLETKAFILQRKKMTDAFSPRRLEWMLSNNPKSVCCSIESASLNPPKSRVLGLNPELCLSGNRTILMRGAMVSAPSIDRTILMRGPEFYPSPPLDVFLPCLQGPRHPLTTGPGMVWVRAICTHHSLRCV